MLEYRGFSAKIFFDMHTRTYYGWAQRANQVISFQASRKHDLMAAMQHAVHSILEHAITESAI